MRFVFILAVILALWPAAARAQAEGIAVVVNGDAVTLSDVRARMKLIMSSAGMPDTQDVRDKLEPQVVNSLIDERLMLQEAARLEIVPADEDISKGIDTLAGQNNMKPDQFRKVLSHEGVSLNSLKDQIRAQIAWAGVVQIKLRPQVDVSDSDADALRGRLQANVGKARYLVSEIFLPIDQPRDEPDVRALADKLTSQIMEGRVPFQRLASQFSQAAGASRGGDMGWVQEGQLPQELESVLGKMNEGDLSKPIRSMAGFHILYLRKKSTMTAEDLPTHQDLRNKIGRDQIDRLQKRYLLDLKADAFIERRGA